MSERSGWLGAVAVGGLAIICCAGPLLVVGAVSLGVGAWLATHSLWLLGGLALLLVGGAVVFAYRPAARQAPPAPSTSEARRAHM
jgi:hypothetical protein